MIAQGLAERSKDPAKAKHIVGVSLYGILMMARRGSMTMEGARTMIAQMIAGVREAG